MSLLSAFIKRETPPDPESISEVFRKQLENKSYDFEVVSNVQSDGMIDIENFEIPEISTIYERNELNNENDIFQIQKFNDSLPDSLPSDIKKTTLKNIITVAGFNVENLMNNGNKKIAILNGVNEEYSLTVNAKVSNHQSEINRLKDDVSKLETEISNLEEKKNSLSNNILTEISVIEKIQKLI